MIEVQLHAARALLAVLRGRSLNAALAALWARTPQLPPAQRGAIQDLAFGACRWLGTIRGVLDLLLRAPLSDADIEALLAVALYQLHWTRAPAHAIVDRAVSSCAALRKSSAKGLVNAVLRSFLRRSEELLAQARATETGRYSYPQWWIDAVRAAWPECWGSILDAGNMHPPLTLRVNRRRCSVPHYQRMLEDAGIPAAQVGPFALRLQKPVPVFSLPAFDDGLVSVQDLGAQYAAPLLAPRAGERVLDACAAPGGKTAHLLEVADIDLLALDRDGERLQRVDQNLRRLALHCRLREADAGALDAWWDGRPFDCILLDAPCTASGVVRRHPDIKWLRRPHDVAQLAQQQARLLDALWQTLVPGGKLLYVTCSIFPAETHAQIEAFLRGRADAQPMRLTAFPDPTGQLLPDANHDGFFYALLRKQPMDPSQPDD